MRATQAGTEGHARGQFIRRAQRKSGILNRLRGGDQRELTEAVERCQPDLRKMCGGIEIDFAGNFRSDLAGEWGADPADARAGGEQVAKELERVASDRRDDAESRDRYPAQRNPSVDDSSGARGS